MREQLNDTFLSLLCGLALLGASRFVFELSVGLLPDATIMQGANPMLRLSLARLGLFTVTVAALAIPVTWPLRRYASNRDIAITLPGAACAAVFYLLLERLQPFHPFPVWLDVARGLVLFAALPVASLSWWRRQRGAA